MIALEGLILLILALLGGIKGKSAVQWWCGKETGFWRMWKEQALYCQMAVWAVIYGGIWFLSGKELTVVRLLDLFISYGMLAIVDGKRKTVPDLILCCFFVGQMLLGAVTMPLAELVRMLVSGGIFTAAAMAFALLSGERIGMGDARLLGVTAMATGWVYVLQILCIGLVLSFGYSLLLLVFFRKGVKTEFPFVPFLAGGILVHFLVLVF